MTAAAEKVTLATSSGALWLALMIHFGAGLMALGSGFLAVAVTKGGPTHRRAGRLFAISMVALGISAVGIAIYERNYGSAIGGTFAAYFALTAFMTVRPLAGRYARAVQVGLMLVPLSVALSGIPSGTMGLNTPTRTVAGVPAGMILFLGTIGLLALVGDVRLLLAGTITGARRLARHLWRMCFGLFIASGSFFLGQMKFLPEPMRILPLLMFLGISPLIVLLYWMWRVRFRKRLQGMVLRTADDRL